MIPVPSTPGPRPRHKHKKAGMAARALALLAGAVGPPARQVTGLAARCARCAWLLARPEQALSFADQSVVDAWGAGDLLPTTDPAETGQLPALDLPARPVPDVAAGPYDPRGRCLQPHLHSPQLGMADLDNCPERMHWADRGIPAGAL